MRTAGDAVAVIPCRYGSTRFPGKPLADVLGRPMMQWVYEAAQRAVPRVIIATDDKRIFDAARAFGAEALMTPATCASGTDRMAFVARRVPARFYVNVQGDEPLLDPAVVRKTLALARRRSAIATAAAALPASDDANPNVVKVALGKDGRALYFSRSAIPYGARAAAPALLFKHIGLYVYPARLLRAFVRLTPPALETAERLEQLRALYHGLPVYVWTGAPEAVGVDTPQDLRRVVSLLKAKVRRGDAGAAGRTSTR